MLRKLDNYFIFTQTFHKKKKKNVYSVFVRFIVEAHIQIYTYGGQGIDYSRITLQSQSTFGIF